MTDGYDAEATCRCTNCGKTFTTSADADAGKIKFDGVRQHGGTCHTDERWDYEITDFPGGDGCE